MVDIYSKVYITSKENLPLLYSNVNLTSILKSPTSIVGHSPSMIGLIEDAGDSGQFQMGGMQFD